MAVFAVTGSDTLTIFDRVFDDFSDGDNLTIAFAEDLVATSTGKNQNTIFAKNEKGNNALVTIRLIRGSSDDQFLAGKQADTDKDFAATVLANGSFKKRVGDGDGDVIVDNYTLQGGMITKRVEGKENVAGDTEQGSAVYTMVFATGIRGIQ